MGGDGGFLIWGEKRGVLRDIDVGVVPSVVCTIEKAQSCVFS